MFYSTMLGFWYIILILLFIFYCSFLSYWMRNILEKNACGKLAQENGIYLKFVVFLKYFRWNVSSASSNEYNGNIINQSDRKRRRKYFIHFGFYPETHKKYWRHNSMFCFIYSDKCCCWFSTEFNLISPFYVRSTYDITQKTSHLLKKRKPKKASSNWKRKVNRRQIKRNSFIKRTMSF